MPKRSNRSKPLPAPNLPPTHPDAIARLADAMEWKTTLRGFDLSAYHEAMNKLKMRGYSFAEIADFLNQHLAADLGPRKVTRGQVYRAYQTWKDSQDPDGLGGIFSTQFTTDEQAEEKARAEDNAPKGNEPL